MRARFGTDNLAIAETFTKGAELVEDAAKQWPNDRVNGAATNNYYNSSVTQTNNYFYTTTRNQYWAETITVGGRVGVGTTTPTAPLHVVSGQTLMTYVTGPSNAYIDLTDGTSTIRLQLGAALGGFIGTSSNHPLSIRANNATKMTIEAGGNVGIAMTKPEYVLDVRGTVNATEFYKNSAQLQKSDISGLVGFYAASNAIPMDWIKLDDVTLGSAGTSIATTASFQSCTCFKVDFYCKNSDMYDILLRFNDDSGANCYKYHWFNGIAALITSAGATSIICGGYDTTWRTLTFFIQKAATHEAGVNWLHGPVLGGNKPWTGSGWWNNSSDLITKMTFGVSGGNIAQDSRMIVWGAV